MRSNTMIVLIDNYDSFAFNLVHYFGELGAEVEVHRNDSNSADAADVLREEEGGAGAPFSTNPVHEPIFLNRRKERRGYRPRAAHRAGPLVLLRHKA